MISTKMGYIKNICALTVVLTYAAHNVKGVGHLLHAEVIAILLVDQFYLRCTEQTH